jgi:hypothetical protein
MIGARRPRTKAIHFMHATIRCLLIALAVQACTQQPPADLSVALKGIEKAKFLACSGPPSLEYAQASQDRMSFVTNLQRGQPVGIASPTALPPESCSVDAVFEHDRLTSSAFSGNLSMCQLVFAPCLQK